MPEWTRAVALLQRFTVNKLKVLLTAKDWRNSIAAGIIIYKGVVRLLYRLTVWRVGGRPCVRVSVCACICA
jgi:hypothetical protein